MRWRGRRQSNNVKDRRGKPLVKRTRGVSGGAAIVLILVGLFFGDDVKNIVTLLVDNQGVQVSHSPREAADHAHNDLLKQFVGTVLAETEDTWSALFEKSGQRYQAPKLVLYEDQVQSACGLNSAASGPFYCPVDFQIYIDLSFLNELRQMGAPGDFAFAYVIAHEVGHHVQNIVGIAKDVFQQQSVLSKAQANALSVKMELQADCFAGIWINHTEKREAILEEGDIEEGMKAAEAVGDDTIMRRAGRAPRKENFTHGSSAERMQWFSNGMRTGEVQSCNTFG